MFKKFTLLELIIVIAILGILLSLLLPSLTKARARGENVVCLSNLKQHTVAMTLYTKENNMKLPERRQRKRDGGYANWALCSGVDEGSYFEKFPTEYRQLNPYLGVHKDTPKGVNLCPSVRGNWLYDLVGTSYQYNTFYGPNYGSNNSDYITLAREGISDYLHRLSDPGKFILFNEVNAYDKVLDNTTKSAHLADDLYNVTFIDGAVKRVAVRFRQMNGPDYSFIHESSNKYNAY